MNSILRFAIVSAVLLVGGCSAFVPTNTVEPVALATAPVVAAALPTVAVKEVEVIEALTENGCLVKEFTTSDGIAGRSKITVSCLGTLFDSE